MLSFGRRKFLHGVTVVGMVTAGGVRVAGAQPVWGLADGSGMGLHESAVRDARMVWRGLPDEWRHGPFLGNGVLTARVFAPPQGKSLNFALGPAAAVQLRFDGVPTTAWWELDLWNAELSGTVVTTRGRVTLSALVHHEHGMLLVSLAPEGDERLSLAADSAVAWREQRIGTRKFVVASLADFERFPAGQLDAVLASHRKWWNEFYPASFLSIPDRTLQRFYWSQLYTAASTGPGRFPALLNGTNQLGLTTLPADEPESVDHLAFGLPGSGSKSGYARSPVLAWGLPEAWRAWQHSGDDDLLRDFLVPKLRRAVGFYADFLMEGSDGLLHLPPTSGDVPDATHELSLLRWAVGSAIEACRALDPPDVPLGRWLDIHRRLTPYHTDASGVLLGAGTRLSESRSRPAHLLWLHPLREMTWHDERDRQLMRRSLDHWSGMSEQWDGESYVAAASMSAAVRAPEQALEQLRTALDGLLPNTLYRKESGVDPAVPFAAADALVGMLIADGPGTVDVFPAAPQGWRDASIAGLRVPGGFLVDASRRAGRTEWVRVSAETGGSLVLRHGMRGDVGVRLGPYQGVRPERSGSGTVTLRLGPGETATFARGGVDHDATAGEVPAEGPARRWGGPDIHSAL